MALLPPENYRNPWSRLLAALVGSLIVWLSLRRASYRRLKYSTRLAPAQRWRNHPSPGWASCAARSAHGPAVD